MNNCVVCEKNIGTIMSYEGGLVYCDQCANICNNCNMWLAVCGEKDGEKDGMKLFCDGCWEENICQMCYSVLGDYETNLPCENCKILTGFCCGAIYWCQHGANICRACFDTYYKLVCEECETEMECPEMPYCQDADQLFCIKCKTRQCDKLVKK